MDQGVATKCVPLYEKPDQMSVRAFECYIRFTTYHWIGLELSATNWNPLHSCQLVPHLWKPCQSWRRPKRQHQRKLSATRRENRTTGLATLGLKGGWIFFAARSLKSMCLWKKGWRLISSAPFAPSRRLGSRFRRAVRMVQASEPNSSPNRSGSFNIFRYILSVSSLRHFLNENSMLSLFNQRTIVERWEPGKHLIQQHSQSPPINRLVCCSIYQKANTQNIKQVLTYHIHFHKESRVPNTPEFHRKCSFYHCPSCSIYTNQSHTAQYGQCNQARCFQASSPWWKV